MMKTLATFFLSSCCLACCAQDYIVTTRMDTLRGRISIISYPNYDKVQVTAEKKTEYAATSVYAVFLDSQTYKTVRILDQYRFLKLERAGLISLFMGRQSPGTPYNIPFLVKKSGESMEVTSLRFKKSMANFLSDCASIKQKIEDDQLGRKDLDKIIDTYNQCIEDQTQKLPGLKTDPRLKALSDFTNKLKTDSTVPADAIDILNDLQMKVEDNKAIPNYLIEGLRDLLKNHPAYQEELEGLIKILKE